MSAPRGVALLGSLALIAVVIGAGSYLQTVRQQHPTYADGIAKVRALTKAWSLL
jgi:hypothetical protein